MQSPPLVSMAQARQITSLAELPDNVQVELRRHWQEILQEFMSKHDGHCFFLQCSRHPCYTVTFTPPQEFMKDPARVFVNATVNDQPMRFSVADLVETPCRLKLDVTGNGCCKCPECQQDMTLNNPVIDGLDFAHVARMMRVDAVMPASKQELRELMRCAQCHNVVKSRQKVSAQVASVSATVLKAARRSTGKSTSLSAALSKHSNCLSIAMARPEISLACMAPFF